MHKIRPLERQYNFAQAALALCPRTPRPSVLE